MRAVMEMWVEGSGAEDCKSGSEGVELIVV